MKNLKQAVSVLVAIAKAKSMAVKSKTNTIKTRLMIFKLLWNKKVLMSSLLDQIHALRSEDKSENYNKKIVPCHEVKKNDKVKCMEEEEEDYPDLEVFDLDFEEDGSGSIVDFVRNSRVEGLEFCLEDNIDQAADVFIRRFHREIEMQKQESFKRYEKMMENSI